ncbi:acetoin utilization protein AcuC [Catenulispora subtropica]|uniref:Acetoin utilization protein AcuC n=1 Tax=Catenulispora subtropica TaxID=450798 RepID=A0ABN2SF16_9ACTN
MEQAKASLTVPWDDRLLDYDFGPGHPLAPVRVDLAMRLARHLGVFDHDDVATVPVPTADDVLLRLVHHAAYVDVVRASAETGHAERVRYGFGTEDNPYFGGMYEAAARVVGASVEAARRVWTGASAHAVNLAGGLHHAMPSHASGFCVFNDPAVAIAWLLAEGARRVAYVDVDVHHGDGVQAAFWDDPRVLTISLHESPRTLFPGTGLPEDVGGGGAEGYAVNVALPAGTGDEAWLRAFDAVVPQLLAAFAPEVLVTQHGCDTHVLDPLAHLRLTVDGQRNAIERLHRLAHEHASGRWLALGGGGYELVDVVPRTWTHLLAEASERPLAPATPVPGEWLAYARARTGRDPIATMTDGHDPKPRSWDSGYDPADPVDRAVIATRRAVFPWHGLDLSVY